jgi:hypothetical protein
VKYIAEWTQTNGEGRQGQKLYQNLVALVRGDCHSHSTDHLTCMFVLGSKRCLLWVGKIPQLAELAEPLHQATAQRRFR